MSPESSHSKVLPQILSKGFRLAPMYNHETLEASGAVRMIDGHSSFFAIDFEQDNPAAGILLIDGGVNRQARELEAHLSSRGVGYGVVRAAGITHFHFDHTGALHKLPSSVRTIIGAGDIDVQKGLRNSEGFLPGAIDRAIGLIKRPPMAAVKHVVPEVATHLQDFRFGQLSVRTVEMPGHTRGSIGFLVRRGGEDQPTDFFPGDAFDFTRRGHVRYAPWVFTGNRQVNRQSVRSVANTIAELNLVKGKIGPSHSGIGEYEELLLLQ